MTDGNESGAIVGNRMVAMNKSCQFASACGSVNGKVERRRRDAGTELERNDRHRTAGGKPADYSALLPLVTNALCCGRNRRGREGNGADQQPVTGARKCVGHGGD
jgi:hypothetical protein